MKTFIVDIPRLFKTKASIVAYQFVPNPDGHPTFKFKNRNTCDYRIDNLEWVPKAKPRAPNKAEYLNELPPNAIKIESFGKHEFNDYYFDPDSKQVIQINSGKSRAKIKIIKPSVSNGREIIVIKDSSDKRRTVGYKELIEFCEECVQTDEEELSIEE
jgi:hypothetical protein